MRLAPVPPNKHPSQVFFRGEDEFDQLVRIAKVLGSEDLYKVGEAKASIARRFAMHASARAHASSMRAAQRARAATAACRRGGRCMTSARAPLPCPHLLQYADKYGVEVDPALVQAVGYRPKCAAAPAACLRLRADACAAACRRRPAAGLPPLRAPPTAHRAAHALRPPASTARPRMRHALAGSSGESLSTTTTGTW